MAEIINMPLLSDTMTEGVIVAWHKKEGERVEIGQLLAEIETDKATMEFEAPADGVLRYRAPMNEPIKVNDLLAIIAEPNESVDVQAIIGGASASPTTSATPSPVAQPVAQQPISPVSDVAADGRLKASPLAKSLARENNVDLQKITGTGDEGRIVKRDIEAFIQQQPALPTAPQPPVVVPQPSVSTTAPTTPPVAPDISRFAAADSSEGYSDVRVSQMRKTIARRLSESKFSAPHFYLTVVVNMDNAIQMRKRLNELSSVKISFNDLIVKATAMALRQHPAVNSSWLGDSIRTYNYINIGVAVAIEDGLVVPVIRHADNKSLSQIAADTQTLAAKAKEKRLQPAEMQGNTFSISNLGMFDIDEFTAIISPPDACILAVGKIGEVPAVVDGEIKIVNVMKLTLSCDHRVVDGAVGARFLQTLKAMLEDPLRLLV